MIELVEKNLGSITLLLTFGTFWMALSTRAAAVASREIFELESRPYVVFNKPMFRFYAQVSKTDPEVMESQTLKLGLEFKNSGRVPVRYLMRNVRMTFDSRTVDDPSFTTNGGLIYPGDFGVFWFGSLPYNENLEPPKMGVIEYELEYEAIDQKRKFSKSEKMGYSVNSFEPYSVDWHYLEDSSEKAL